MPNTQAVPKTFKVELLKAVHAFGTPPARSAVKDVFKAALFFSSATINADTTAYTTSGEATGAGYTAAGIPVTNGVEPTNSGGTGVTAYWTPSASLSYGIITVAAFDCVLIYNDTAAGKPAVSVNTFGSTTVTGSSFTLTMPANTDVAALLRITS